MSTVESNNADGSGDSAAKLAGSNGGEESVANQNGDALEAAPVLSNDEAAIDAALAAAVAGEENVDPNVAKSAHPLGEEVWGLKMVLPAPQINAEHPTRCSGDGCNLVACTIWSSNHDPETPWYSCLDCQEEDFGGWPTAESGNLPLKAVSDSLLEAMTNKCTMKEDPNFPNLPPVIEIEASQVGLSYELESNGDSDDRTKAVEFGTKVVYAIINGCSGVRATIAVLQLTLTPVLPRESLAHEGFSAKFNVVFTDKSIGNVPTTVGGVDDLISNILSSARLIGSDMIRSFEFHFSSAQEAEAKADMHRRVVAGLAYETLHNQSGLNACSVALDEDMIEPDSSPPSKLAPPTPTNRLKFNPKQSVLQSKPSRSWDNIIPHSLKDHSIKISGRCDDFGGVEVGHLGGDTGKGELGDIIVQAGGVMSAAITGATTIVVACTLPGRENIRNASKNEKITVISLEQLNRLVTGKATLDDLKVEGTPRIREFSARGGKRKRKKAASKAAGEKGTASKPPSRSSPGKKGEKGRASKPSPSSVGNKKAAAKKAKYEEEN